MGKLKCNQQHVQKTRQQSIPENNKYKQMKTNY